MCAVQGGICACAAALVSRIPRRSHPLSLVACPLPCEPIALLKACQCEAWSAHLWRPGGPQQLRRNCVAGGLTALSAWLALL